MATLPGRVAGRYIGAHVFSSAGAWTDISYNTWAGLTNQAIPSGSQIVSLQLHTLGVGPAFLLFRANNGEATTLAARIEAGATQGYECFVPDNPITVISVYGVGHLQAFFI